MFFVSKLQLKKTTKEINYKKYFGETVFMDLLVFYYAFILADLVLVVKHNAEK